MRLKSRSPCACLDLPHESHDMARPVLNAEILAADMCNAEHLIACMQKGMQPPCTV